MKLLENLNWRYATKKFDPSKKIEQEDLGRLMEAVRLSVSSYGLQFYNVLVIENQELREKLREASWNQAQITDASHLFVFCNYTSRDGRHIDEYIQNISLTQGVPLSDISGYGDFIKKSLSAKSDAQWHAWSERQTYLALSNLLLACADLRIDACPMEGFEPEKYNAILGLDKQELNAVVIAPVGYRSEEDETQFRKKVRKSRESLFQLLT
ncbi:NAD(P)H-dependent oxidoreductase [Robiginitalea biformata]|uniref:Nitroreductase domain-containing protein n=1 Tax=Robiginitalea biformata (strain ATCC BAA-864 / DSM 15991 / KCTC 12146 / HTCC2501) TaxID=313596 RepID=A4CMD5_ROBBH|nr:NAD(P)H-dependent oxidoreductase [Robiginitalea biformata]EAR14827.1 hypothetical protein RB2501_10892 [Robiginitalea biformata HTCC2501]